jgi:hypothetical protein
MPLLFTATRRLGAAACLVVASGLAAAIELQPIASGLASPLYLTHAGDGTQRLFIVERGGTVRVLQPGASTPTLFLDISARIVSGGEQGLLGLAFHPQYAANGRFFTFSTRNGGDSLVIAEHRVSATNPNLADTTETALLTIAHPTNNNHNGGMLAFGPNGLLHVGVGDGGSGNDPPNNAQNIETLLGKILRLDVSTPGAYAIPPANPFVGRAGRDEIHSYGWRNPWRFSFDRATGQGWVADVGQGAREEVNAPLALGSNYGWRVYEGTQCTNLDPALCGNLPNYVPPLFDYSRVSPRCSVTGGYVYRGAGGAVPTGTYLYADYCSGEIFAWNGSAQSVLLDTTLNISSFGEDEQGELYVVSLGGTVSKIVASAAPCTYSIQPTRVSVGAAGATGTVSVSTGAGCAWSAASNASWIALGATGGVGPGSITYNIAPYTAKPKKRNGNATVAGQTFTVQQSK